VVRTRDDQLLLGEWACLGALYPAPTHGFAIAGRLKPDGDIGRVWSMSRALTYRALEQLVERGLAHVVGEEPGIAGGNRTVLAATRSGRARLRKWLQTPVAHMRDVRSELLLKIVLAEHCGIDISSMLTEQRSRVAVQVAAFDRHDDDVQGRDDVVMMWRRESARSVLHFLDAL
jgi:PadR family transcriptional regulator AphA